MTTVGLRELRQQASDLVRRAEAGEDVTISVAGRPSVRLVPVAPRRWRSGDEIAELFDGPADTAWERDRDLVDQQVADPWSSSSRRGQE